MAIQNSNLACYANTNVDMAVSVKERALNSQLRQYLASISSASDANHYQAKMYILQYKDKDKNPILFTVSKDTDYNKLPKDFPDDLRKKIAEFRNTTLFNELENLDLFHINNGTQMILELSNPKAPVGDAAKIQKASGYYLKYALFIEDGMPDIVIAKLLDPKFKGDPDTIIKPITLQSNKKNVSFRQFFRNICGIQLSTDTSGSYPDMTITTTLSKSEQKDSQIWYFPFDISLDFRATDYNHCSEDVKKKIMQMANVSNPDDVFNISQLSLDLQTLSTTMTPTISGFDHDIDTPLTAIVRTYFDRLEKAGQTMFGSVITSKPASDIKYLFTPKMRNYHVAPRTLDYLIGFSGDKTIPNLGNDVNLQWDTDDSPLIVPNNPNDAAVAISSAHLLPFITNMIRPALKFLPNEIQVFCNTPVWDTFRYSTKSNPQGGNPAFSSGGTSGKPNYSYSYYYKDETDRHLMWQPPWPTPVASSKVTHKYYADVTGCSKAHNFNGTVLPAFVFDFRIKAWVCIDYNTNESCQGFYFDKTVVMAIGLKITANGNIEFVKSINTVNNNPGGIPKSGWVEFMSFGMINDYVDSLVGNLTPILSDIEKYAIDEFSNSVNSQIGFVMPGSKTFTFIYDKPNGVVNAVTPSGDLYLFGNYVQELAK